MKLKLDYLWFSKFPFKARYEGHRILSIHLGNKEFAFTGHNSRGYVNLLERVIYDLGSCQKPIDLEFSKRMSRKLGQEGIGITHLICNV